MAHALRIGGATRFEVPNRPQWHFGGGGTQSTADQGDTATKAQSLSEACANVEFLSATGMQDVVADKGNHSAVVLAEVEGSAVSTVIAEPERGQRKWSERKAERDRPRTTGSECEANADIG